MHGAQSRVKYGILLVKIQRSLLKVNDKMHIKEQSESMTKRRILLTYLCTLVIIKFNLIFKNMEI